jgi:lysophospholipase L1-like esterase
MRTNMNRRDFLKLGLAALVSTSAPVATLLAACSPKNKLQPTPTATMTPLPSATATPDTSPHIYPPEDANIRYVGRIDFSDVTQPKFSAPGVYIQARFYGTGAAVMLKDEFKWGTFRNYYDAVVDGTTVVKVAPESSITRYEVAAGLPAGEHTLTLVKRTEASIGACTFLGFEFAGTILPPPEKPSRRIECIGDSITCGAGDEAFNNSKECSEDGWGQPYNNARLAYGPVLAQLLNADYHLSAVSGIGLIRNYSFQYDARPMPEVYDSLFFELTESPKWDPKRYVPDVIVVALGTNDFSPGDSDRPIMEVDTWVAAGIQFLDKLRGFYPDAHIFCASSPMLGDHWPTQAYRSATDQRTAITQVVEHFNQNGDDKVHKIIVTQIVGMGCGTHPDVKQHTAMAESMSSMIASIMGW